MRFGRRRGYTWPSGRHKFEIGFQYSPGAHASGTEFLHVLLPGSHHCPGGQFRGCAEAVPDIAIDIAAIGAAAAAITIERRMILFMSQACPNRDRLKQCF